MTAMAAALSASGAMAENIHPVVQSTDLPLSSERALVEETRQKASAACNIQLMQDLTALGAVIENGVITNREGVIAVLEALGAPEGNLDGRTEDELLQLAGSMPLTNVSGCIATAEGNAIDSYEALSQVLNDRIASLGEEAVAFQELIDILFALEGFADGNAPILQEIALLREEATQLSLQADASGASADASAASADASAASADVSAASADASAAIADANEARVAALVQKRVEIQQRIEAIWTEIAADA